MWPCVDDEERVEMMLDASAGISSKGKSVMDACVLMLTLPSSATDQ